MQHTQRKETAGAATRREFLKRTATAAAAVATTGFLKTPVYGQATAPSANVAGANSRLVCGIVGLGNQGLNSHLVKIAALNSQNNTVIGAVCDLSKFRLNRGFQAAQNPDCKQYADYRQLLAQKDLDAVFVATHDHWHAKVGIDAVNAGKHAYVEKPMSRYLREAFELYDAVKKTGKIVQVGSQGCSDLKWHKAAEVIKKGTIGPVVMSQGSYMRNNVKGEWNYNIEPYATADDVNWETWLGPVKTKKAFNADDFFRWRKYYRYCAGLLGDLFPHKLHPYMLATGNPEFPTRVAAIGTRKVLTDKNTPGTPLRDSPEILQLIADFPSGMTMHMCSSSVNEQGVLEMIRGQKGSLYMGGNKVELKPEKPFSEEFDPESFGPFEAETFEAHHKNFFESIRANKQPNCNVDLALRVQTVVCLGEMANRLSTMVLFDEKTRKCTDASGKELAPFDYGIGEEPTTA